MYGYHGPVSRRLSILSFALGAWALVSVLRAMSLADDLASPGGPTPGSLWLEVMIWLVPILVAGFAAVLMVTLPSGGVDVYLARNVRLAVMVAVFAVLLSWALVLMAGYVGELRVRS